MQRFKKSVAGLTAVSAAFLAAAAYAAPQESVNYTAVDSTGAPNAASNEVRNATFVGGYSPKSIRITGQLTKVNSGTFRNEARIMVFPPSGTPFELQPALQGSYTGTVLTDDLVLPIPTSVADAAGEWTFRFYESFDDGSDNLVDSTWDSITLTLDDAGVTGLTTLTGGSPFLEAEPNDSTFPNQSVAGTTTGAVSPNGGANDVTLAVGEAVTGTTTGSSTTVTGGGSVDNFLIRTPVDVPAVYRYQLILGSSITGHTATLRGASQTANLGAGVPGLVLMGAENTFQTGQTVAPNRINQWYGFGKGEAVHYRVAGTGSTTGAYTSTLSRTTVTPTAVPNPLAAGNITIARGTGNTATCDVILMDSNFNPISNFHSMSAGTLVRNLSAGTYYVAVSNTTTSNSHSSPGDSTIRTNTVMNTPDGMVNNSTTTVANMGLNFTDGLGTQTVAGTKGAAFDAQFFQFTVQNVSTPPTGTGSSTPASVIDGGSALLRVNVTPGASPASTGIAVVADLSSIGGSGTQTFVDDGTNGDVTAGDNIFSYAVTAPATAGPYTMPFTVSDAEARSSGGNISMTVFNAPSSINLGALPSGQTDATSNHAASQIVWYRFSVPAISHGDGNWLDLWTTGGVADTEIGVYTSAGNLVGFDDDDGAGNWSAMSFGQTTPTRPLSGGEAHNGRDGALAAGEYYLAVGVFNTTFNATAFSVTSTGGAGTNLETHLFRGPAPSSPTITGNTSSGLAGGPVLITGTVVAGALPTSTGLAATADLSSIGGAASAAMYDDGTNGDATAGDLVFSLAYTLPGATAGGSYAVPLSVTDAESRSGTGNATVVVDEAGDTIASAREVNGVGAVTSVSGTLSTGDADIMRIFICDPANFTASTVGGTSVDTQLFLFRPDGTGVAMNDDEPSPGTSLQSHMSGPVVNAIAAGEYYLAISQWDKDPRDSAAAYQWLDQPYNITRAPDGPAAANALDSWDATAGAGGAYTIAFTGVNGSACQIPCGTADFDGDGDVGTDADIEAFFACLAGNCCATCYEGGADFDADGDVGTDADIESFFRVLAGGPC